MIDYKQLKRRCLQSINGVKFECKGTTYGLPGNQYTYIDNGSDILAVCHLDTVQHCNHFDKIVIDNEVNIFNSQLDDRLGIYTILDLLPSLGINFDILLTENEEAGQSTAQYFQIKKKYNWIVEFDRAGQDCVTYDCDCEDILKPYFTIGFGTFSDITSLVSACASFNIGIGYYNEHSKRAYFIESQYISQIEKFIEFYNDYRNIYIPYQEKKYSTDWHDRYKNQFESEIDDQLLYHCEDCGFELYEAETETIVGYICCHYCQNPVILIKDDPSTKYCYSDCQKANPDCDYDFECPDCPMT